MRRYKVVIELYEDQEVEETKSVLKEKRHYTDKEMNEEHRWMHENDRSKYIKEIYGRETFKTIDTKKITLLEQTVSELNIVAVIKAINNIDE